MPCKPCLGSEIKKAIVETFPGLEELLGEIPSCDSDVDIELCTNEPRETTTTGKKKRAPSKYNLHTSSCMKSGKSMKECAAAWHATKGK